jgi:hypothetical protein
MSSWLACLYAANSGLQFGTNSYYNKHPMSKIQHSVLILPNIAVMSTKEVLLKQCQCHYLLGSYVWNAIVVVFM